MKPLASDYRVSVAEALCCIGDDASLAKVLGNTSTQQINDLTNIGYPNQAYGETSLNDTNLDLLQFLNGCSEASKKECLLPLAVEIFK